MYYDIFNYEKIYDMVFNLGPVEFFLLYRFYYLILQTSDPPLLRTGTTFRLNHSIY
jgi:hypothetical protein